MGSLTTIAMVVTMVLMMGGMVGGAVWTLLTPGKVAPAAVRPR